jgi:effector-binding domain-containing protein
MRPGGPAENDHKPGRTRQTVAEPRQELRGQDHAPNSEPTLVLHRTQRVRWTAKAEWCRSASAVEFTRLRGRGTPCRDGVMEYEVTVADAPARRTLVVAATTTWQEFPVVWRSLSGEVWECLRASGIERGCRNVILYRDGTPSVEVGVLIDLACALTGRVLASTLPAGTTATTVHRGPFTELGAAHDAVLDWCTAPRSQADRDSVGGVRPAQRRPGHTAHRDFLADLWGYDLIHLSRASRGQCSGP